MNNNEQSEQLKVEIEYGGGWGYGPRYRELASAIKVWYVFEAQKSYHKILFLKLLSVSYLVFFRILTSLCAKGGSTLKDF